MLGLAALFFIIGFVLLLLSRHRQKDLGLTSGRLIYIDTHDWETIEKSLYDPELGLTGRPDYLVENKAQIIPVEVKSRHISTAPYDSHIFQLAAYCLLVHRSFNRRPAYGILHYPNRTYAFDYTPELENALLEVLANMRNLEERKELMRSHESSTRCSACGFRSICNQRL